MSEQKRNLLVSLVKKTVGLSTSTSDCCGTPTASDGEQVANPGAEPTAETAASCCGAEKPVATPNAAASAEKTDATCCGAASAQLDACCGSQPAEETQDKNACCG
jgi:hypothetical protein